MRACPPYRLGVSAVTAARLACLLILAAAAGQTGAQPLPEALETDGPVFEVERFGLRYALGPHPELPRVRRLLRLEVELGQTNTGFVAPREGVPTVSFALQDVQDRPLESYHASAVQVILETIFGALNKRGIGGVFVGPDPQDIDAAGKDVRPENRRTLRILITVAVVTELRTLASGDRIEPDERLDHPAHHRIAERSP